MDRTSKEGRRLAWLNRFGAGDYHTFPVVAETRVSGERTRIFTRDGYRTVATDAAASEIVLSEPCDAATAMWLAGIFSSPAVWRITGPEFERVEVSGGEVRSSPLQPQTVRVEVLPAGKSVSRKF